MPISWLHHKPHAIAVYASWPPLPSAHATLATGRPATALPGPVFRRLDCTSFGWRFQKSRLTVVAWEVIYVDDNSPDGTPQEVRRVGQKGLLHPPDWPARLGLCGDQGALSLPPNTSQ